MLLQPRKLHNLSTEEALRRVGKIALGRVLYFSRALPNVWPTNHLVDGDMIVVNAHADSELSRALRHSPLDSLVIAYEVDDFDSIEHSGWCVVVTGPMMFLSECEVRDHAGLSALRQRLTDLVAAEELVLLGIRAEIVSGYELGSADERDTA